MAWGKGLDDEPTYYWFFNNLHISPSYKSNKRNYDSWNIL